MKKGLYSIRDEKSGIYCPPYCVVSRGIAIRDFADLVMDKSTVLFKHPGDYRLYYMGDFDDLSGRVDSIIPEYVLSGTDVSINAPIEGGKEVISNGEKS